MVKRTLWLWAILLSASPIQAYQTENPPSSPTAKDQVSKSALEELSTQQRLLADRFGKLEELFLRMSELESATNPARSGILLQAAKFSKEQAMVQRLQAATELLTKKQFTRAIEEQQVSSESLKKLLELLQSENRHDRVREERKKYEQWIKDIKRLERVERSLRGRTENGQDLQEAAKDQANIDAQAGEISKQMDAMMDQKGSKPSTDPASPKSEKSSSEKGSDPPKSKEADPKDSKGDSDPKPPSNSPPNKNGQGEKKDSSDKGEPSSKSPSSPKEKSPQSGKTQENEKDQGSKPNEEGFNSPPNAQNSSDASPSESQPSESQPSNSPSQSQGKPSQDSKGESPSPSPSSQDANEGEKDSKPESVEERAKKRVDEARKRMQRAMEELKENRKPSAIEEQKGAEKELQDAVIELERILRQLREEEVERSLAALESRFRRMLEMQITILESTQKLDLLQGEARERQLEIQSSRLSLEERKVLVEGQRAMMLLQEEGSSMAFPEALQQMLGDIENVVERLQKGNIGKLTISIEEEIVVALEELIEALKQEQKKKEEKKKEREQENGGPDNNPSPEQPLVDALAELRLIKTLQIRINKRTDRLSEMLADPSDRIGQVKDQELRDQLKELAEREKKVQQVTREIVAKASRDKE